MIPALISFLVVAVLSMSGLVASADAAGPGDFLFGLDTAIEDLRLSLTRDDEKKAELRLEFATERLEELQIEIEGDGQFIAQAIAAFEEALAAIEGLLDELSLEQRAAFEQALAQLMASEQDLIEFEFELTIEDGKGELKIEIEIEGDEADHEDHDLDDNDLDDDDLEEHDLDDHDLDDDEDCDSSGPGSGECEGDDDEHEGKCDSSGPGSGDCEDDDKDHDDDDEEDDD